MDLVKAAVVNKTQPLGLIQSFGEEVQRDLAADNKPQAQVGLSFLMIAARNLEMI